MGSEMCIRDSVCVCVCVCVCVLLCVSTFVCAYLNGQLHDSTTTATTIFMNLSNEFDVIARSINVFLLKS